MTAGSVIGYSGRYILPPSPKVGDGGPGVTARCSLTNVDRGEGGREEGGVGLPSAAAERGGEGR